jgi:ubiquinone/menaquinone biosynthesis C-methylase UbiE
MPAYSRPSSSNFDNLAKPYRWLEYATFGPFLWRARISHIAALKHCQRVLLAGEGDGRFLAELHRRHPSLELHYLDSSEAMLNAARQRCPRAKFHQATLPGANLPSGYYDAVVTNFFLDCFTPETLPQVIGELAQSATPNAIWLIADFKPAKHLWGRFIVAALYKSFSLLTNLEASRLVSYEAEMQANGFALIVSRTSLQGLLSAEIWHRSGDGSH